MTKNYSALHESMQTRTLANGLRICYLPKEGFSKTFAILATDFGSVDASFTFEGKRYDTPAGVAHFLEHKMFEDEDGNALQKFARTGASPNAFTSHTMTAYHFSCTDRFEENLKILLKFVFTPYFTDENVEKERGIINQEIRMVEDTPNWEVFVGAYEGLYRNHPVRVSIPGSEESISHITPELLYTCHRAFYSPKNMALVVCGTADFEQVCRMAEEISPKDAPEIGQRHYGERRAEVHQPVVTRKMQVSLPQCMVGFKDEPVPAGESRLRRSLIGDLAVRILCGDTPELLYTCHRAFYSPKNMALVVCGTADFEQVCRMAEEISPKDAPEIGQRHYGERRAEVHQPVVTRKMQVSLPQCMVGFKDEPVPAGESRLRRSLIGDLAVRILCGDTSPLYAKLYEKRLLGRDFDVDYSLIPDGACAILGGESRDPAAVREALERETARLAQEGIEPKLFRRMKNALYGMRLRMLDVPDLYARQEIASVFAGEHYLDFAGLFDTIHAEDVQEMFRRWAQPNRSTMSVVEPK